MNRMEELFCVICAIKEIFKLRTKFYGTVLRCAMFYVTNNICLDKNTHF